MRSTLACKWNLCRPLRACEAAALGGLRQLGVTVTLDLPPWPIGTVGLHADLIVCDEAQGLDRAPPGA